MKSWLKLQINIIALSGLMLPTGCVEDKSDRPSTANIETVIDQGRYDEAIYVLNSQLTRPQADTKSRLLLASAYAGRAGVKMREFMQVARTWTDAASETELATEKTMTSLFEGMRRQAKSRTEKDLVSLFEGLYRNTIIITKAVVGFSQIPALTDTNQLQDIQRAVETLQSPDIMGGGALYRGLLRLIIFKNDIIVRKDQAFLQSCQLDVERLRLYLDQTQRALLEIMADFAL